MQRQRLVYEAGVERSRRRVLDHAQGADQVDEL